MNYQYLCAHCGQSRDVAHTPKECDTHVETCACGHEMHRAITGGQGFILQGVSWERDNYCNHGQLCSKDNK